MNRRHNAFLSVRAEIGSVASGLGRQIVRALLVWRSAMGLAHPAYGAGKREL